MKRLTGFSLTELLLAMVIGLVVLLGIAQIFISTKGANALLVAEAELQENARFAFSSMTSIIQQTAHFGCRTSSQLTTQSLLNFNEQTFQPWRAIEGWEAAGTQHGSTYQTALNQVVLNTPNTHWSNASTAVLDTGIEAVKDSDIVKVWYASAQRSHLTALTKDRISFAGLDLEQGDIVVLNDCKGVTFAQVCRCEDSDSIACMGLDTQADISVSGCSLPGNKAWNPNTVSLATAEISILREAVFFVGKRDNQTAKPPSLFMHRLGQDGKLGEREEIMEGVESVQILYGEDYNNDQSPDTYLDASRVSQWENVVSLRVSLLLRSRKNNLVPSNAKVYFNGATVSLASGDHHLRRVYTSTISLRNRNIGY